MVAASLAMKQLQRVQKSGRGSVLSYMQRLTGVFVAPSRCEVVCAADLGGPAGESPCAIAVSPCGHFIAAGKHDLPCCL